jgi:membrane protease YdiL (CAAX protease family)
LHALLAFVAAWYAASFAIAPFPRRGDPILENLVAFSALALAVVVAAIISQRGIRPGFSLLSRTSPGVRWAGCIAAGLVLMSLESYACSHLLPASTTPRDVSVDRFAQQVLDAHGSTGSSSAFMLGFWAIVAGPAAEELVWRGLFFNAVAQTRKRVTPRYATVVVLLAAILSSLLFAGYHTAAGDAASTIPDRFAAGMILCAVYWQTGSLLPAIAVHGAWNLAWFQDAALGSRPAVLGVWPAIDLPILLAALTALAALGTARKRRIKALA